MSPAATARSTTRNQAHETLRELITECELSEPIEAMDIAAFVNEVRAEARSSINAAG